MVNLLLDSYNRRARFEPALLAMLPIALLIFAVSSGSAAAWGALISILVWGGLATLLTQIVRDSGKALEPNLFSGWGGTPTTKMLRLRTATNLLAVERRHAKLQQLVPDLSFPTIDQERADPCAADHVYGLATTFLLERTRDKTQFPLVFEENCNYGFRRNMLGVRPLGIVISLVATIAMALWIVIETRKDGYPSTIDVAVAVVIGVICLIWWLVVRPTWVKVAADRFAERLLASVENL